MVGNEAIIEPEVPEDVEAAVVEKGTTMIKYLKEMTLTWISP